MPMNVSPYFRRRGYNFAERYILAPALTYGAHAVARQMGWGRRKGSYGRRGVKAPRSGWDAGKFNNRAFAGT